MKKIIQQLIRRYGKKIILRSGMQIGLMNGKLIMIKIMLKLILQYIQLYGKRTMTKIGIQIGQEIGKHSILRFGRKIT